MTAALVCKDVKKNFGSFAALQGASFDVKAGECFGLLGPNGAGKSTLINMIYGATSRTSGEIQVFGQDPQVEGRRVRAQLGVVTQSNHLDSSMSVMENMQMYARYVGLPKTNRQTRIEELLDFMMLSHKSNAVIESLSGGMKRRLVFVRALLHDPKLLILDEPTTGLDPAVRQLLWDKVGELKAKGTTILLTTHYMDEAERLCDRLIILDGGLVKTEGTPRQLIARNCPAYYAGFEKSAGQELRGNLQNSMIFSEDKTHLMLGANDLNELSSFVTSRQLKPIFIRPSNLEDVFLKITGKELSADD